MKTAFVTGAGRGLGKGFVDYLLQSGVLVFAGVQDLGERDGLGSHDNLRVIALELSSDESISRAVAEIAGEVDHLDYLINNAGVNKDTATGNRKELVCELEKLDRHALLRMLEINTVAPMLVLQKCLPLLSQGESFVVNISSAHASYHDELPNESANYGYRASKAALNMMTFCSVLDLPAHVRTFAVHPGDVKTGMNPDGVQSAYDQAEQIMQITVDWKDEFNGKFLRYDGTLYPL